MEQEAAQVGVVNQDAVYRYGGRRGGEGAMGGALDGEAENTVGVHVFGEDDRRGGQQVVDSLHAGNRGVGAAVPAVELELRLAGDPVQLLY